MDYLAAKFLNTIYGLEGTATGGDDIVDNDNAITGLDGAFDEPLGTVPFGFLANHEAEEWPLLCGGGDEYATDNWVRPDAHATKPGEFYVFEEFEESPGDLEKSFGAEGDLFAIEVIGGFFSRGECEIAKLEGSLADEIHEALAVEHGELG